MLVIQLRYDGEQVVAHCPEFCVIGHGIDVPTAMADFAINFDIQYKFAKNTDKSKLSSSALLVREAIMDLEGSIFL